MHRKFYVFKNTRVRVDIALEHLNKSRSTISATVQDKAVILSKPRMTGAWKSHCSVISYDQTLKITAPQLPNSLQIASFLEVDEKINTKIDLVIHHVWKTLYTYTLTKCVAK